MAAAANGARSERVPNEELKLTALASEAAGSLRSPAAPVNAAPQLNSGALGGYVVDKPIRVSAAEVSEQLDALMSRRRAREDIEAWAAERMRASDEERLEFDPPTDEDRLWGAILYLLGVGIKTDHDTYLHSVEDFEHYRREAEL